MKTAWQLHFIAITVVLFTLSAEAFYLFAGTPVNIPDVLLGRILGTFDSALLMVLAFYYSSSLRQVGGGERSNDSAKEEKKP